MTWTEVLINFETNRGELKCPKCGGSVRAESESRSVTFTCEDCNEWAHFDKVRTDEPAQK